MLASCPAYAEVTQFRCERAGLPSSTLKGSETDDDKQFSARRRIRTSPGSRPVEDCALPYRWHFPGCDSCILIGGTSVVVDRLRLVAPDGHFGRRTHPDQRGSAHSRSSNSAASASGNRELYDG